MDNMPTLKSVPPAVAGRSSSMETSPTVSEGVEALGVCRKNWSLYLLRVLRASVASFLKQFQHGDTEITEPTRRNPISPTDCFSGRQKSNPQPSASRTI